MTNYALLIGNDINNISPGVSWKDLLKTIIENYKISDKVEIRDTKPFPMLYEEIFLNICKKGEIDESDLKSFIGQNITTITQNEIHEKIRKMAPSHIMTTNYDFSIQGGHAGENTSVIKERTYSIFRRNELDNITYWHVHGDANSPLSINLGYEHYCGQLQNMRNYVVSGTDYKSKKTPKESLIRRLKQGNSIGYHSWIDLFFTTDIHILGLALDFVESDLWWLLTYRARNKFYKNKIAINNKIFYYMPKKYEESSLDKINFFAINDVQVIIIDEPDKTQYYRAILKKISG